MLIFQINIFISEVCQFPHVPTFYIPSGRRRALNTGNQRGHLCPVGPILGQRRALNTDNRRGHKCPSTGFVAERRALNDKNRRGPLSRHYFSHIKKNFYLNLLYLSRRYLALFLLAPPSD